MAELGSYKVQREGNTVVKRARPGRVREHEAKKLQAEAKKLDAASRVAASSNCFVAPELISFQDEPKLTMSFLADFVSLRDLDGTHDADLGWFEVAGAALCEIHNRMEPENLARLPLPYAQLHGAGTEVWLHGDYTKSNVGICGHDRQRKIGVVDWQTTNILDGEATVGPIYFDVAWFVSGLFLEPPHRLLGKMGPEEKASAFVAGYAAHSASFEHAAFVQYSSELLRVRTAILRSTQPVNKRLGLKIGLRRWRNWIVSGEPQMTIDRDYRTSHMGEAKASRYHDGFTSNPYRSMMWTLEREALGQIVDRLPSTASLLDFATGSGRVLQFLEGRFDRTVGVDISESMIDIAGKVVQNSELIVGDLTSEPLLVGQQFDVITAFRFFPNAQSALRDAALEALLPLLTTNGRFILNNHKNSRSVVYRMASMLRMNRKTSMSHEEVENLASAHGLEIEEVVGLGSVPSTEKVRLLPRSALLAVEQKLAQVRGLQPLAVNQLYVLKRRE